MRWLGIASAIVAAIRGDVSCGAILTKLPLYFSRHHLIEGVYKPTERPLPCGHSQRRIHRHTLIALSAHLPSLRNDGLLARGGGASRLCASSPLLPARA